MSDRPVDKQNKGRRSAPQRTNGNLASASDAKSATSVKLPEYMVQAKDGLKEGCPQQQPLKRRQQKQSISGLFRSGKGSPDTMQEDENSAKKKKVERK